MMDLLFNSLRLMFAGKLFRDPLPVYRRLALFNTVAAALLIAVLATGTSLWLAVLPLTGLGLFIPYSLRNVKYR